MSTVRVNEPGIENPPRRYRISHDNREQVRVYATFRDATLADVIAATQQVDPSIVRMSGGMNWHEPATADDLARWDASDRSHDERHARWERETYERLRAKYEGGQP